jgi:hypothetical protein
MSIVDCVVYTRSSINMSFIRVMHGITSWCSAPVIVLAGLFPISLTTGFSGVEKDCPTLGLRKIIP